LSKPSVIIRMLEDSTAALDQRLLAAYMSTQYWIGWPDENGSFVTIGSTESAFINFLHQENIGNFVIITASNPFSQMLEEKENEARNVALLRDLQGCTTLLLPARNITHDGSWPVEHGFCAAGIWEAVAMGLGRRFGQNAVVWWQGMT